MNNIENVIYRYDPQKQPCIRYHAIPSACTGSAENLEAARSSYRNDRIRSLHVDRHNLPPKVEHLEAAVSGMWVRTRVGAVHRDHRADRMFLQTLLGSGSAQDALRAAVDMAADRGLEPVVVIVEPTDNVGSVLDQMTARDTLVVAYSDVEATVRWALIHGPEVGIPQDISQAPSDADLRDIPVWDFVHQYCSTSDRNAVRMDVEALRVAS